MRLSYLSTTGAAFLTMVSAAAAQENKSPMPSHFPLKQEACYGRVYNPSHLAKHPRQITTAIHLFHDLDPDQTTEDEPQSREELLRTAGENGSINLSAFVQVKTRKGLFWNVLNCNNFDGKKMRCGVDCDGGSFELSPQDRNLSMTNNGFVLIGGCGASDEEYENRFFFSPGADDKTFRLEPLPVAQCVALREQLKPAYAKMGAPLRVRFAKEEASCYTRTYDEAHLKKNPQQIIRKISLLKVAGGKDVHKDAPGYDLTFRIETKDGKKFTQSAKCYPDRYAYTCPVKAEIDTAKDFYVTRAGENALMIRDRSGKLKDFFGAKLGNDDRLFKLETASASACEG